MYSKKNSNTELHPKAVRPLWHIQGLFLDQGELWTCVKSPTVEISISEPAPSLQLIFFFLKEGEQLFDSWRMLLFPRTLFLKDWLSSFRLLGPPQHMLVPSPAVSIAQVWCRKQRRLPVPRLSTLGFLSALPWAWCWDTLICTSLCSLAYYSLAESGCILTITLTPQTRLHWGLFLGCCIWHMWLAMGDILLIQVNLSQK